MWSTNYAKCVECGGTDAKMMSRGRCARCYLRQYRSDHAAQIAKQKREWYDEFVKGTDRTKIERERKHFDGKREKALKRDGYRCVRCQSQKSLVVHHKDGRGRSVKKPNNKLSNFETLCRKCHINEHRAEIAARKKTRQNCWSRNYERCQACGTTNARHASHGYCLKCVYENHERKRRGIVKRRGE